MQGAHTLLARQIKGRREEEGGQALELARFVFLFFGTLTVAAYNYTYVEKSAILRCVCNVLAHPFVQYEVS